MRDETTTGDALAALRAADPALRVDLARVGPEALGALRDAVPAAAAGTAPTRGPRRRWARRTVVAGGVVAALVGGGAAYAGYQSWYAGDGGAEGVTCTLAYGELGTVGPESSGGPVLTGDPVADCAHYQELVGLPPIPDPVAFRDAWHPVVVAPADQVPPDATLLPGSTPQDRAVRELEATFHDYVDGVSSTCATPDEAIAAAQAELDRLGLSTWRVELRAAPEPPGGACASVGPDPDAHVLVVHPLGVDTLETLVSRGDMVPWVRDLRDALRAGVAEQCLGLADAEAVVDRALGSEHHWPTTVVEDPEATCTRVDLEVGGSVQVTLRGPEAAAPPA
ncbi:hypothetical protein [Cellulomonas hominis]|uniref:hypothetical protein n=1 Tax=Cellulomonas hominis TaxID=156981 RepID=UPI001B9764FD|nr:hypothetical protein [Cellulomonas hominis]VTR76131.1 hypothetical protein CHMI_00887 [Cellulomonas hominis]